MLCPLNYQFRYDAAFVTVASEEHPVSQFPFSPLLFLAPSISLFCRLSRSLLPAFLARRIVSSFPSAITRFYAQSFRRLTPVGFLPLNRCLIFTFHLAWFPFFFIFFSRLIADKNDRKMLRYNWSDPTARFLPRWSPGFYSATVTCGLIDFLSAQPLGWDSLNIRKGGPFNPADIQPVSFDFSFFSITWNLIDFF